MPSTFNEWDEARFLARLKEYEDEKERLYREIADLRLLLKTKESELENLLDHPAND